MDPVLTAPPRKEPPAGGGDRPGRASWRVAGPGSAGRVTEAAASGTAPGSRPAATLALAVVTLAAASGLYRVFSGHAWVGPVLGTVAVVHLLCWALRRGRVGSAAAVPIVAAAIVLMVSWTVFGRYTTYGVPTGTTWHHAMSAIHDLGDEFASLVPPVAPTRAFELLAVGGAALAAAIGDWAAFRWRAPLVAMLPGLAAFIFSCTSGQGRGRGAAVAALVAAICLFLLVERATAGPGQVWFAGSRAGVARWALLTGGTIAGMAVVSAAALSPALSARDGRGVLGWRSGFGANGGERIVPNPLVDLRTRLTQYYNRPVFLVSSSVPSYWRLTSLDTFDGTTWTSTGSYGGFGSRLPGAPPAGPSVRTVRATFQIQLLDSPWLPAQFNPYSVQGVHRVSYDDQSNSLLTAGSTSDNLRYTVSSYQYLDTLDSTQLQAAPPLPSDSITQRDTSLPASVGTPITDLAQSITAGLTTEYDKAMAIQSYLRSPRFSYSLNPRSDGSGNQALYNFLFVTRSGYCQQFAGAYAVLARAAGLPTRLAFGFVTGERAPGGGYQVRDRDSHTWPEVYFGPRYGWVPFEPTPGFSVPGTSGYAHTSGSPAGPVSAPATVPTTLPDSKSTTPGTAPKSKGRAAPDTTLAPAASVHHSAGISPWWLVLPGLAAAWVALVGGGSPLLRRLRRKRAHRAGPHGVVLNAWSEVTSDLLWQGIERRPDETDDEFARRASATLRRMGRQLSCTHGGLEGLAGMARRATFARSVPDGLGAQATAAAAEIEKALTATTSRRRRLSRAWSLPPGTWRRLASRVRDGAQQSGGAGAGMGAGIKGVGG